MKTLILARHSIAENNSESGTDHDRKLTANGKHVAKNQINKLLNKSVKPELLYSSHAKRALETAVIFQKEIQLKNEILIGKFLYFDYTTNDFLNFIGAIPNEFSSAMIVAHNPTIANMAYRLSPEFNHPVQPSTIMVFGFDVDNWNEIEVGRGKLKQIIIP